MSGIAIGGGRRVLVSSSEQREALLRACAYVDDFARQCLIEDPHNWEGERDNDLDLMSAAELLQAELELGLQEIAVPVTIAGHLLRELAEYVEVASASISGGGEEDRETIERIAVLVPLLRSLSQPSGR